MHPNLYGLRYESSLTFARHWTPSIWRSLYFLCCFLMVILEGLYHWSFSSSSYVFNWVFNKLLLTHGLSSSVCWLRYLCLMPDRRELMICILDFYASCLFYGFMIFVDDHLFLVALKEGWESCGYICAQLLLEPLTCMLLSFLTAFLYFYSERVGFLRLFLLLSIDRSRSGVK